MGSRAAAGFFLALSLALAAVQVPVARPVKVPGSGRAAPARSPARRRLLENWTVLLWKAWLKRMGVEAIDNSWEHLFPDFRDKLTAVLDEAENATGGPWVMAEGYRSAERQTWLYAQGRTRPGNIVTWKRTPSWHGTGLAADCYPKAALYNAPQSLFAKFREIYQQHGLTNPAWGNGDRGHVQLTDSVLRQRALAWVRNGFETKPYATPAIKVYVDDQLIPDADAYLDQGHVWLALRPVADALDLVIGTTESIAGQMKAQLLADHLDMAIPLILKYGRGFTQATNLPVPVVWDEKSLSLHLKEK